MTAKIIDFQEAREALLVKKESVPQEQQAHADIERRDNDKPDDLTLAAQKLGWTVVTLLDSSQDEPSEPEEADHESILRLSRVLRDLRLSTDQSVLTSPLIRRAVEELLQERGS